MPASQFADILHMFDDDVNALAYQGKPLATCSEAIRGQILATLARRVDSDRNPEAHMADPVDGKCVNGARRGRSRASYDWLRNGQRVECKSARFSWIPSDRLWKFKFYAIKFGHSQD